MKTTRIRKLRCRIVSQFFHIWRSRRGFTRKQWAAVQAAARRSRAAVAAMKTES